MVLRNVLIMMLKLNSESIFLFLFVVFQVFNFVALSGSEPSLALHYVHSLNIFLFRMI